MEWQSQQTKSTGSGNKYSQKEKTSAKAIDSRTQPTNLIVQNGIQKKKKKMLVYALKTLVKLVKCAETPNFMYSWYIKTKGQKFIFSVYNKAKPYCQHTLG